MPLPFAAFLPLIGSAINAGASILTNNAQKNTNLDMYNRQRADALADWNRQNLYNSPAEQMKRFKEAGLNPHLIYGQTTNAAPVRSSDAKPANLNVPTVDNNALNAPLLALQMDNMKKQGSLMDAQAIKTNSETNWRNLNTKFLEENFETKSSILSNQRAITDSKALNEQRKFWQIEAQIKKTLADTDLSVAKKAEVSQMIKNLKTAESLLGEKVKSEQYLNSIQQKLQSFGIVGSTLSQILRLFK